MMWFKKQSPDTPARPSGPDSHDKDLEDARRSQEAREREASLPTTTYWIVCDFDVDPLVYRVRHNGDEEAIGVPLSEHEYLSEVDADLAARSWLPHARRDVDAEVRYVLKRAGLTMKFGKSDQSISLHGTLFESTPVDICRADGKHFGFVLRRRDGSAWSSDVAFVGAQLPEGARALRYLRRDQALNPDDPFFDHVAAFLGDAARYLDGYAWRGCR